MSKNIEWAGHVWRSNGITKKPFEGEVDGKIPYRDRPRQRLIADRINDHDLNQSSQGTAMQTIENCSIDSHQMEKRIRGSESPSGTGKTEKEQKKKKNVLQKSETNKLS